MKKVTKVFSVMVASVALAAMLSGCGGDKKPAGGDTIKVGGNLEMTGGSASFGISSKNAIELAFKNINDKGGINGKKLELVVADSKSEAAEATNAMQKLVSQDKVVAVIGPNLSSATIAAGAINNGSKVLDIAPMATPTLTLQLIRRQEKQKNIISAPALLIRSRVLLWQTLLKMIYRQQKQRSLSIILLTMPKVWRRSLKRTLSRTAALLWLKNPICKRIPILKLL